MHTQVLMRCANARSNFDGQGRYPLRSRVGPLLTAIVERKKIVGCRVHQSQHVTLIPRLTGGDSVHWPTSSALAARMPDIKFHADALARPGVSSITL